MAWEREPEYYTYGERPLATPEEAHREWHANTRVPMGQPGCPQDACHPEEVPDDPSSD